MNLHLLDFDCSEDPEGVVCWDALAQPAPHYNQALLEEVALLLAWSHRFAPQGPGPLEDGADWDLDLQVLLHNPAAPACPPLAAQVHFDPTQGQVSLTPAADQHRIELSLSLSGTPAFAQALRAQFNLP